MATAYHFLTSVLGVVVVVYLATFVLFAILRILTGVSIQRIGYLSFKRISYEPTGGVKIEVRKLGLLLHRPTFAQPTWVSIVVSDSQLSVDLKKMEEDAEAHDADSRATRPRGRKDTLRRDNSPAPGVSQGGRAWERVRELREKLQKLHKLVKWLQMVDVVFTNTKLSIFDVGRIEIGSMTTMLDTRQKTADRSRMFDHCMDLKENQKPVEWMFTAKSVLFFHEKKQDPIEIMDHCMFNVYGVLEGEMDGIGGAAISLKFGKINLPCDQILGCWTKLQAIKKPGGKRRSKPKAAVNLDTLVEDLASLPGRSIGVIESKEFMQSLLRGVKELQFAIGYLIISKAVTQIQPGGRSLQVVVGMKELGMDVHRLDQKSPAHRMYIYTPSYCYGNLLIVVHTGISRPKTLLIKPFWLQSLSLSVSTMAPVRTRSCIFP